MAKSDERATGGNAYRFRAYCDICKTGMEWVEDGTTARELRREHFESEHQDIPATSDNLLLKLNARIQRRRLREVAA